MPSDKKPTRRELETGIDGIYRNLERKGIIRKSPQGGYDMDLSAPRKKMSSRKRSRPLPKRRRSKSIRKY